MSVLLSCWRVYLVVLYKLSNWLFYAFRSVIHCHWRQTRGTCITISEVRVHRTAAGIEVGNDRDLPGSKTVWVTVVLSNVYKIPNPGCTRYSAAATSARWSHTGWLSRVFHVRNRVVESRRLVWLESVIRDGRRMGVSYARE